MEVLIELKEDMHLKSIPVILTTSNSDEDIAKAYNHHTNCYIRKHRSVQLRSNSAIGSAFLVQIVTLPSKPTFRS